MLIIWILSNENQRRSITSVNFDNFAADEITITTMEDLDATL